MKKLLLTALVVFTMVTTFSFKGVKAEENERLYYVKDNELIIENLANADYDVFYNIENVEELNYNLTKETDIITVTYSIYEENEIIFADLHLVIGDYDAHMYGDVDGENVQYEINDHSLSDDKFEDILEIICIRYGVEL